MATTRAAVTLAPRARLAAGARALSGGRRAALERPYARELQAASRWSGVRRGLAGMALASAAGVAVLAEVDEGTGRSLLFWRHALPIFLHYRWVQWRVQGLEEAEQDAAYAELHKEYSPVVEAKCLELRGFYLKVAQLVSTLDYFLPEEYLEWCRRLQDQVPVPLGCGQARRIIEKAIGHTIEEVFTDFEDEACGSASIGQVHRARLRSTGQLVAIKVQGPEIEGKFRADIGTLIAFCKLAMPQHVKPMEEIEAQFETEFDYVGEANNLDEIYRNIMPRFGHLVAVPKPILSLCSKQVLVMEFLKGPSLLQGAREQLRRYAESLGRPYEEVEEEQLEKIKQGQLESIEHEARRMRFYQAASDVRWAAGAVARALYNWTAGWVAGPIPSVERPRIVNLAEILRVVALVHGHEILVDGSFNCDPHPGNIVLMPDGRLGLIDYGQCKHVDATFRHQYARLLIALAEEDKPAVVRLMREIGMRTKYDNPDIMYKLAQFWHDRNSMDVTDGRNVQDFMDHLESTDPMRETPGDLVFPGRVSVLMRGMGNYFGMDMSMAKLWRPIAEEVLSREAS